MTGAPPSEALAAPAFDEAEARRLAVAVGARIRAARSASKISRAALAERAGVSARYLAEVEAGRGNISLGLLFRVAAALDAPLGRLVGGAAAEGEGARVAALFEAADAETRRRAIELLSGAAGRARRIALIGLRGAGKSTLGRRLAAATGAPFVELGHEIEAEAGMPVGDVLALYGAEAYRDMERAALVRVAERGETMVLAVAGGVVEAAASFETLLARYHAVWLRARPEEHMARVRAQGDERPMAGIDGAMDVLRRLLAAREPLYARAEAALDTGGRSLDQSAAELARLVADRFGLG
ncbi:MAG: shikimate kinase [Pseudomonadota bacterium]